MGAADGPLMRKRAYPSQDCYRQLLEHVGTRGIDV
jgi:hypothetical protein